MKKILFLTLAIISFSSFADQTFEEKISDFLYINELTGAELVYCTDYEGYMIFQGLILKRVFEKAEQHDISSIDVKALNNHLALYVERGLLKFFRPYKNIYEAAGDEENIEAMIESCREIAEKVRKVGYKVSG